MAERNNALLQDAITEVNELAKKNNDIFAIYVSDSQEHNKSRQHVIRLLNQREFVSAAVLSGALHEKMYKDCSHSMFLRDWQNLCSFSYELRRTRNNPTIFQEFERLARHWQSNPLKTKTKP